MPEARTTKNLKTPLQKITVKCLFLQESEMSSFLNIQSPYNTCIIKLLSSETSEAMREKIKAITFQEKQKQKTNPSFMSQ